MRAFTTTLLLLGLVATTMPAANALVPATAEAAESSADVGDRPRPEEGTCTVCERRGGAHGVERFVAWREHDEKVYGFCNESCAEAFDQMPSGYADPVLPRPAPDFAWTSLEGEAIAPGDGSMLLVDFWATWCKPCLEAMPDLEELAAEFADDGLRVVGVSIDEERETLDRFLRRRPIDYAVVHDGGDDPAWWAFRVPAIPAAFLLDAEGRVVDQWSGEIDGDEVRAAIRGRLGE